jgi:hypothetical protein
MFKPNSILAINTCKYGFFFTGIGIDNPDAKPLCLGSTTFISRGIYKSIRIAAIHFVGLGL